MSVKLPLEGFISQNYPKKVNLCSDCMCQPNNLVTFAIRLKSTPKTKKEMNTDKYHDKLLTDAYLTETYKSVKEGRSVLTYRLKTAYASDEECIGSFEEETTLWRNLKHPHIVRINPKSIGEESTEVTLETTHCVTLEEYLHENPSFVTEREELERIVNEVCEALDYLHQKGICQLDLHPRNILLTKGDKRVKLCNPFFTYTHLIHGLGLKPNGYVATELFGQTPPTDFVACDIYALGRLIAYLYDMTTLPLHYRQAVLRATSDNPTQRPASIAEFRKLVEKGRVMQTLCKGGAWALGTLMAAGLLFWITTSNGEEDIRFVEPTANNTYVYDSITGQEYYLNDSAMAAREAAIERQKSEQMKEYERKLNDIFKKDFYKKAAPVINEIYSKKHMNSETGIFTSVSNRGMLELKEAQEELARQYGLDLISTSQVAADVIEELTRQRMMELQNE